MEETQRLRSEAIDALEDVFYVFDEERHLKDWNRVLEERYGYDGEELEGKEPHEFFVEGERERVVEAVSKVFEDGCARLEAEFVTGEGERLPMEFTGRLLEGEDGEAAGFSGVGRDVSDRRKWERELREREERFRRMFNRHSAPMLLIEPGSGRIREANEAAVDFYGYTLDDLTAKSIQEINQLSREEVARERKCAEREDRNHFFFEHELSSGEVRTVEVHSSPIEMDEQTLLFSIIHDITEQREYEEELERSKRELETSRDHLEVLDRVLRHNLQNRVNIVAGYADSLSEKLSGREKEEADIIRDTAEDLLRTAEKEREIVKLLSEEKEREEIDLVPIAKSVSRRIRRRHPDAKVVEELPEEAYVEALPEIEDGLEELMTNSVIHNDGREPRVEVEVAEGAGVIVVSVRDDGPGIPDEEVGVLTEEGSIDPLYHGSGLGLWLVNWIIRKSEGKLEFWEDGDGSVVTIELSKPGEPA